MHSISDCNTFASLAWYKVSCVFVRPFQEFPNKLSDVRNNNRQLKQSV